MPTNSRLFWQRDGDLLNRSLWNGDLLKGGLLFALGLYVALAGLYLLAVPSGESPDEPGHLQCIEQVSLLRRLPQVDPPPSGQWWSPASVLSGHMCYHMPLYYILAGTLQLATQRLAGGPLHYRFPPHNPEWGASPAMFAHETDAVWWHTSEPPAVLVVRLASIGLGGIVVWAGFRLARALLPGRPPLATASAIMVAGWPQFVYMSRAISNDVLASALLVVVLVLLVDVGKPRRFAWATLAAVLATLAKLTAWFTAGLVVLVFAWELWLAHEERAAYLRPGLVSALLLGGLVLLFIWQPTLHAHLQQTLASFTGVSPAVRSLAYWRDVFRLTLTSGWAHFGWMNLPAPAWQAYGWWTLLAAAGLWGARNLWLNVAERPRPLVLLILVLWTAAVAGTYLRINLNRFQPQFRFAFALLPIISTLAAAGYLDWFARARRRQQVAVVLLAAILFLANVWIVLSLIVPAYT